jgi:SAM-dependent methyltransferase
MKLQKNTELYDPKHAVNFYEDRYEHGYMDEWPIEQKRKLFEVIQDLHLPATGEALDFGCGNGVLTEIIRQALPSWDIYGTDISNKAIANAKIRYKRCIFFEATSSSFSRKKFDFVFTNHVLEHVSSLSEVFDQIDALLKPESSMLHFLPCGNEGSYEYDICLLQKNGINREVGNRFFFEDEGHLRRLTTDELCKLCKSKCFELKKEFYSYQYYGAIDWITSSDLNFVLMFSEYKKAINEKAKTKLKRVRIYLVLICVLRIPARIVTDLFRKKDKKFKHYILLMIGSLFFIFSRPIDSYWKRKSREEWDAKKNDRNGSEMCLYFMRS